MVKRESPCSSFYRAVNLSLFGVDAFAADMSVHTRFCDGNRWEEWSGLEHPAPKHLAPEASPVWLAPQDVEPEWRQRRQVLLVPCIISLINRTRNQMVL